MAVRVITGKPGSGKSYWAVHHMVNRYFTYDQVVMDFIFKVPCTVISNIDELKLDHFRLDEKIEQVGKVESFFEVNYQKAIVKKYGKIVYIIDEAHKYFPVGKRLDNVPFMFQYHRHLGIDIYLITTSIDLMPSYIKSSLEYIIEALPRSKGIGPVFHYKKIVDGDVAGRMAIKKDKKIFRLYKSMDMAETEVVGSMVTKYMLLIVLALVGFLIGGYYTIRNFKSEVAVVKGEKRRSLVEGEESKVKVVGDEKKESKEGDGNGKMVDYKEYIESKKRKKVVSRDEWVEVYTYGDLVYSECGVVRDVEMALREGVLVGKGFYVPRSMFCGKSPSREGGDVEQNGIGAGRLPVNHLVIESPARGINEGFEKMIR